MMIVFWVLDRQSVVQRPAREPASIAILHSGREENVQTARPRGRIASALWLVGQPVLLARMGKGQTA